MEVHRSHNQGASDDPPQPQTLGEQIAHKLELLLDRFPKADGRRWRGVDIEAATGGEVSSSYFSGLRRAQWDNPGIKHLVLISDVMDFPLELFRLEPEQWDKEMDRRRERFESFSGGSAGPQAYERAAAAENDPFVAAFGLYEEDVTVPEAPRIPAGEELATLLNILFESKPDPRTGHPYTNDRAAHLSQGLLDPKQIARMRAGGRKEPPPHETLAALSQIFAIPLSYWYVSNETKPVIDLTQLEELLTRILDDDRLLIVRSGDAAESHGPHGSGEPQESGGLAGQARMHDGTRRLVAAMLNRIADTPGAGQTRTPAAS